MINLPKVYKAMMLLLLLPLLYMTFSASVGEALVIHKVSVDFHSIFQINVRGKIPLHQPKWHHFKNSTHFCAHHWRCTIKPLKSKWLDASRILHHKIQDVTYSMHPFLAVTCSCVRILIVAHAVIHVVLFSFEQRSRANYVHRSIIWYAACVRQENKICSFIRFQALCASFVS